MSFAGTPVRGVSWEGGFRLRDDDGAGKDLDAFTDKWIPAHRRPTIQ